jgi:hypothetical protein
MYGVLSAAMILLLVKAVNPAPGEEVGFELRPTRGAQQGKVYSNTVLTSFSLALDMKMVSDNDTRFSRRRSIGGDVGLMSK